MLGQSLIDNIIELIDPHYPKFPLATLCNHMCLPIQQTELIKKALFCDSYYQSYYLIYLNTCIKYKGASQVVAQWVKNPTANV